ncbi:hypothetical protein BGZ58_001714 [Dissophora ornata]|nr:hypothetical protein BGZ58_001714 [Dissophora ornata]
MGGQFRGSGILDDNLPGGISTNPKGPLEARKIAWTKCEGFTTFDNGVFAETVASGRWFAGPLHNTSCDEQETDEEDDESRRRALAARGGEAMEDNDDMDDRDAALFGMDDDEGEDEWEDMSSSDADEEDMDDEEEEADRRGMARRRSADVSSPLRDAEVSADTGDDGDNEGTGVDTEDGGGTTTEDGVAAQSTFARNLKNERRTSVATVTRSRILRGESSSEQEQRGATSSRSAETESVPVSEAENTLSDQGHQNRQQQQEEIDEHGVNQDPSLFVSLVHEEEGFDGKNSHNPTGQHSAGVLSPSTQPPLLPQYPSELLLCATSRNIYLLSRHPAPPEEPKVSKEGAANRETSSSESAEGPQEDTPFWMTPSHTIEDEDEDDQLLSLIGLAHEEMLGWPHEEEGGESEYDPDYDTDPYYEDMDEFMGTADEDSDEEEEGQSDGDDEDEDVDMDEFSTYHGRLQHPNVDDDNGDGSSNRKPAVPMLHTISVARAAAARADGRRFHHLEHFDRLFVMLLVPELSVLVAASQKGSVTIFRLLRVLDDAPTPLAMAQSSSSSLSNSKSKESAEVAATSRKHRARDTESSEKVIGEVEKDKETTTQRPTITIQGAKYVLFPEMYLPRLEPPPFPLFGVSIVPLQRPNHLARSSSSSNNPSSPSSACSSASYMLHLAYFDSQFYSYEIRLRNEKDDPVGLSNVFV